MYPTYCIEFNHIIYLKNYDGHSYIYIAILKNPAKTIDHFLNGTTKIIYVIV